LKDLITSYVQQGLERETPSRASRTDLPYIAKASVGGTIPALTAEELARIEEQEDLERLHRSTGR